MRRFEDATDAQAYAELGGQALLITGWTTVPKGDQIIRTDTAAHLFDQDVDRLQKTVKALGETAGLSPMEWRPGWGTWYVPLASKTVANALKKCHSRIVRKTVRP